LHVRPSSKRNIAKARPLTLSVSKPDEALLPSEPSIANQPLNFHLNELNVDDLNDFLGENFLNFLIMIHSLILMIQLIALYNALE